MEINMKNLGLYRVAVNISTQSTKSIRPHAELPLEVPPLPISVWLGLPKA